MFKWGTLEGLVESCRVMTEEMKRQDVGKSNLHYAWVKRCFSNENGGAMWVLPTRCLIFIIFATCRFIACRMLVCLVNQITHHRVIPKEQLGRSPPHFLDIRCTSTFSSHFFTNACMHAFLLLPDSPVVKFYHNRTPQQTFHTVHRELNLH